MRIETTRARDDRPTASENCPSCGSPIHGDAMASGTGIHFCSRCTWYQIRTSDGQVTEEDPSSGRAAA